MDAQAMATLNRIAARQRGLFTLEQALRAGWVRDSVRLWVEGNIWEEVAPRVYRYPLRR